ncbi:MAG: OmpA family protein [Elusimicrobiota bacterium]
MLKNVRVVIAVIGISFLAVNIGYSAFWDYGFGPRPMGMGGAFTGIADDSNASIWNPAGLGMVGRTQADFMYAKMYMNLPNNDWGLMHGTLAYPWKDISGTVGLTVTNFDVNSLYLENMLIAGYGTKISGSSNSKDQWYAGLNAKYLMRTFKWDEDTLTRSTDRNDLTVKAGSSSGGISVDAGVLGHMGDSLSIGIIGKNLTQPNVGLKYEDKVPMEMRAGMGYKIDPKTVVAADVSYRMQSWGSQDNFMNLHFGVETWLKGQPIAVRAGYDMKQGVSGGASYIMKLSAENELRIDYALLYSMTLNEENIGSHRVGVNLAWGKPPVQKVIEKKINVDVNAQQYVSPNGDKERDTVDINLMCSEKNLESWKLEIKRDVDVVRVYESTSAIVPVITWDVTDKNNKVLPDGKYSYGLVVKTLAGKTIPSSTLKQIIVDTKVPTASITASTYVVTPDNDGKDEFALFKFNMSDDNGVANAIIKIFDANGKEARKFDMGKQDSIMWDCKDDYYKQIVPNGKYTAKLFVFDNAGNQAVAEANITVDVPPQVVVKEVVKEVIKEVIKEVPKEVVKEIASKDVQVQELPEGLKLTLGSGILFDSGKSTLRSTAYPTLDKIVKLIEAYPGTAIRVEGHSDSVGSQSLNNLLSELRARSVADYIIEKGVPIKRISCRGLGASNPVSSNKTEQGRTLNRRVEIFIGKKAMEPTAE